MFLTVRITAALFLAASLVSFAFPDEMLCKHWVCGQSLHDASAGDTIKFTYAPYDYEQYTWGTGILTGIEFKADGSFQLHHNVMCSTESPTLMFEGKWKRLTGSTIHITAPGKDGEIMQVIKLNDKELLLVKK